MKFKITELLFLMILFALSGCNWNPDNPIPADKPDNPAFCETPDGIQHNSRQMIALNPAANADLFGNFTGYGYNVLNDQPANGIAIWKNKVNLYTDNRLLKIDYHYIETLSDFKDFMRLDTGTGVDIYSGGVTFNTDLGLQVENSLETSSKTIFVVVRGYYQYGTVILAEADMEPAALTYYQQNRDDFYKQYGNAYIVQNIIGDTFYYIYKYKFTSACQENYFNLTTYVHARIEGIFDAEAHTNAVNGNSLKDKGIEESITAIGNGYIPGIMPKTREEAQAVITEFSQAMKAKYVDRPLDGDWTTANSVGTVLDSFENLIKVSQNNVNTFYLKYLDWYRVRADLIKNKNDLIKGDVLVPDPTRSDTISEINIAIGECEVNIDLCKKQSPEAVFPAAGLYSSLLDCFKPQPGLPACYVIKSPGDITFRWTPQSFYRKYRVYLNNTMLADNIIGGFFQKNLTQPGLYYWVVRGYDVNDNWYDSESMLFNIPGIDTVGLAADGTVDHGPCSLSFIALKGKLTNNFDILYTLYRDGDPVYEGGALWADFDIGSHLYYEMKLKATFTGAPGIPASSAYGEPVILYPRLLPTAPTNNSQTYDTSVFFSWQPLEGAEHYELYIDDVLKYTGSAASATVAVSAYGEAAWYVKAVAANGLASRSVPYKVTIIQPEVVLTGPENNSQLYDTSVAFGWNRLSGIDHYELYINDTLQYSGVDNSVTIGNLAYGNYSWYLKVFTPAGLYFSSNTRGFSLSLRENLALTGTISAAETATYQARNITANNLVVMPGANIVLQATNSIYFGNGCSINNGAVLTASVR